MLKATCKIKKKRGRGQLKCVQKKEQGTQYCKPASICLLPLSYFWRCRQDKNSVSSPPLEPCFDIPNNSPNHLLNSLLLCLEKLAKKSSNQTTHLFSCQNSL